MDRSGEPRHDRLAEVLFAAEGARLVVEIDHALADRAGAAAALTAIAARAPDTRSLTGEIRALAIERDWHVTLEPRGAGMVINVGPE
jgi:hypothetical protein